MGQGDWIKAEREARGMKREELAVKLGVNPVTIYRWETTDRAPHKIFMDKLRGVFDQTPKACQHAGIKKEGMCEDCGTYITKEKT